MTPSKSPRKSTSDVVRQSGRALPGTRFGLFVPQPDPGGSALCERAPPKCSPAACQCGAPGMPCPECDPSTGIDDRSNMPPGFMSGFDLEQADLFFLKSRYQRYQLFGRIKAATTPHDRTAIIPMNGQLGQHRRAVQQEPGY